MATEGRLADQGLDAAVQRVEVERGRHVLMRPDCTCGWLYLNDGTTFADHVNEAITRAAREDVREGEG